ncbi:phosphoribosyltransferase-like protein [Pseudomonas sp. TH15]|uniref:phosphoribosyltransferase-like protein n=1 Tax=Pseudomonas sp. TH15 TaxID=2796381 RepID=UPI00406C699E
MFGDRLRSVGQNGRKKEWDDDRRVQSSLGFSDFQRLLVFPYSVPKTTLPILWLGQSSEIRWTPLFPVID